MLKERKMGLITLNLLKVQRPIKFTEFIPLIKENFKRHSVVIPLFKEDF